MKNSSIIARLVLVAALPLASSSFAMNPGAQAAQPDIVTMVRNVVDLIKRNPLPSALIGGVAALIAYRLATMKSGATTKSKNGTRTKKSQEPRLQQGIAYLAQHAAQAVQLYQAGKLPRAYLHGKYCEIAQQAGFDALPQAERIALLHAVVALDLAFTGYDYTQKKMVGVQAAFATASAQFNTVVQQLMANSGANPHEPSLDHARDRQAKSVSSAGGANGLFQAFMDQFRANPMATIGLILTSGYSLLAQYNGWPPYGPNPAPQQPAPEPAV